MTCLTRDNLFVVNTFDFPLTRLDFRLDSLDFSKAFIHLITKFYSENLTIMVSELLDFFFFFSDDANLFFQHRDINMLESLINSELEKGLNWLSLCK